VIAPTDYVVPAPPPKPAPEPVIEAPTAPEPVIVAPPRPAPKPVIVAPSGPVAMSSELSVACAERSAPAYPAQSRRLGETGLVVLRVELNETGDVAAARVNSSSSYIRLDEAALAAVRTWRCTPATRNGQPVRAIALQPFNFVLQGN
jgi:protein TonB